MKYKCAEQTRVEPELPSLIQWAELYFGRFCIQLTRSNPINGFWASKSSKTRWDGILTLCGTGAELASFHRMLHVTVLEDFPRPCSV